MTSKTVTERKKPREMTGFVVSDKMDKTITVESYRMEKHPKYGKFVKKSSTFKVHSPKNEAKVGDKVLIFETRPMSKTKSWALKEIIEKAVKGNEQ